MPNQTRLLAAAGLILQGCAPTASPIVPAATQAITFNFDDAPEGTLPASWHVASTSPDGPDASWQVRAAPTNQPAGRALTLVAPNRHPGGAFNVCWTNEVPFQNGSVEVRVRANSGTEDQGGGPIWRVLDASNYWVARYNPLEKNLRVYVVQDGQRKQLASAEHLSVGTGEWFTIKIVQAGPRVQCWLNGERLLDAHDAALPNAGGVGVWTKADAASSFDDLLVMPQP